MDKIVTLELTVAETNMVLEGLSYLSVRTAMPLISKITTDANKQVQAESPKEDATV